MAVWMVFQSFTHLLMGLPVVFRTDIQFARWCLLRQGDHLLSWSVFVGPREFQLGGESPIVSDCGFSAGLSGSFGGLPVWVCAVSGAVPSVGSGIRELCSRWGFPWLDLFPSHPYWVLLGFRSDVRCPLVWAVAALSFPWPPGLFAFPPILPRVLRRIRWEWCCVFMVAPFWP